MNAIPMWRMGQMRISISLKAYQFTLPTLIQTRKMILLQKMTRMQSLKNSTPVVYCDTMEPESRVVSQMFMTPQNRKVLADIDIDVPHPPKPPVKQGTLKCSSFGLQSKRKLHLHPCFSNQTSPMLLPLIRRVNCLGDDVPPVPMITLYPPIFDAKLVRRHAVFG